MNLTLTSRRLSAPAVLAVTIPLIGLIGWLDYESGPIAMSLFYFVPIVYAAWVSRPAAAITTALVAGAAWLTSELTVMPHDANIILWNGFTRCTTFVILAVVVGLVRRDRDQLDMLNTRLNEALESEVRVARTDALTGLPNSRSFREALEREVARSHREESAIGIGYIDLDNFKKINDTMGHHAGDDVLLRVGDALRRNVRTEDLAARLGGDEFAILSVRPTEDGLASIGDRIMSDVAEIASDLEGIRFGCTIGFVLFPVAPQDTVAAVREADELMYEVKARSKGSFEVRVSNCGERSS